VSRLRKTPPFRGSDGEVLPGSIAEVAYHRLGGLDQWVMIRGETVTNPPLILLHGGPGLSETRFFRLFNAPLENTFHGRLLGSARRGQVVLSKSPSFIDDD
jgi:pimeloyl-ACP methyl ester carboxylesterase